jgi:hypothetical protein
MGGLSNTIMEILKKTGYLSAQYGLTAYYWTLKTLKVQLQNWKKCGAQKKMAKAYSSLGAEVYSLSKQGEANWQNMPSVQQQVRIVEETESRVFDVDEAVEEIEREFQSKKEEIKETYSTKRAEVSKGDSEEQ